MRRLLLLSSLLAVLSAGCVKEPPPPDPKQQAEGHYLQGQALYLDGKFEESLAAFERVKALQPEDPRLTIAYGEVFLAQKRLPEALGMFEKSLTRFPDRATSWSRIGYIHAQLGDTVKATEALTKALSLNPNDWSALEELGELHAKAGRAPEAVKSLVKAAIAAPTFAKATLYLRAAELLVQTGNRAEAIAVLSGARSAGVTTTRLLVTLGDYQVGAGDLRAAVATYEQAARGEKKDPTVWELVGNVYVSLDRPADAEAAFRESLRISDRGVVHAALGSLALSRGDKVAAEAELAMALRTAQGREQREMIDIADLLVAMGRGPDALQILQAISAEPDSAADVPLQEKTAALAKKLNNEPIVAAACERLAAADAGLNPACKTSTKPSPRK